MSKKEVFLIAITFVLAILLGLMLLIAEKTTAGLSFIIMGLIILLPIKPVPERYKFLKMLWVAVAVLIGFVGVISIANTDIPPEAQTVGIKFVDQVITIFQNFVGKISSLISKTMAVML